MRGRGKESNGDGLFHVAGGQRESSIKKELKHNDRIQIFESIVRVAVKLETEFRS